MNVNKRNEAKKKHNSSSIYNFCTHTKIIVQTKLKATWLDVWNGAANKRRRKAERGKCTRANERSLGEKKTSVYSFRKERKTKNNEILSPNNDVKNMDAWCKQVEQKNISRKRTEFIPYRNEFDRCEGNAFVISFFLSFLLCRTTKRNDTFHFGMLNARWSCVCVRVIVFKIWIWNVDVAKHSQAAVIITSRSSRSDSVNSHRAVLCEVIRECRQSAHAFFIPSVSRTELSWVELRRVEPSTVCLLSPCVSVSAYVVIHSGDGNSSSSSSIAITPLTISNGRCVTDSIHIRYLCKLSMYTRIDMGRMESVELKSV